jgi:phospholipid/cholesterol/gamma-HCH transport system substrate-binding protein
VKRLLSRLGKGVGGARGRTALKLTVYSFLCLLTLAKLVSLIGNVDFFADETGYEAEVDDVTGLLVNDEVKVAGVPVGKVTGISVDRGVAVVKFKIDAEIELRDSTQVGVRWRNIFGQKYLYLYPGDDGGVLEPGDRLPLEQAVSSADVGDFLNAVGPVLQAIDPADANAFVQAVSEALQGNESDVRGLIDDAATVSQAVGGLDEEVGRVIENMEDVLSALADRDDAVDATIRNLSSLSNTLAANNDALEQMVVNFAEVQSQLDELVTSNRGDLDAAIANLQQITDVLAQHRDDLEAGLSTLPTGLIPYHQISSYGQWFQVRAIVVCLANQSSCSREDATSGALPGQDTGDGGATLADVVGFALSGGNG